MSSDFGRAVPSAYPTQPFTVSETAHVAGSAGAQVTTAPATVTSHRMYVPGAEPPSTPIWTGWPTANPVPDDNVAPLTPAPLATVAANVTLVAALPSAF